MVDAFICASQFSKRPKEDAMTTFFFVNLCEVIPVVCGVNDLRCSGRGGYNNFYLRRDVTFRCAKLSQINEEKTILYTHLL